MITLRRAQVAALAAPQLDIFLAAALRSLTQLFPDDARLADTNALRLLVQDAISQARTYQLERERELLLFIYLVFDLGSGFETRPGKGWIEGILRNPSLDGGDKLDAIYSRLESESLKAGS